MKNRLDHMHPRDGARSSLPLARRRFKIQNPPMPVTLQNRETDYARIFGEAE